MNSIKRYDVDGRFEETSEGDFVRHSDHSVLVAKLLSEQDYKYNKQINELLKRHVDKLELAAEFCRQLQIENKKLKAATTECYEKNLDLNLENFELKANRDHLQFLLDSVMLEHCPDEMTEEQMDNWKKAQRVVDTADPEYYNSDTYKNNIKFSVDMIK